KRASKDKGVASGSERDGGPGASEERSAAQPREHRTGPRDLKFHGDEWRAAGGAVGVEVVEWAALPRDDEDGRGARPVGGEVETETPGAAGIERGGMVGEYEAETTDERGDVAVRREGGTCGREALVRGGDAGAGRIVQVEVGEEVQPRRPGPGPHGGALGAPRRGRGTRRDWPPRPADATGTPGGRRRACTPFET